MVWVDDPTFDAVAQRTAETDALYQPAEWGSPLEVAQAQDAGQWDTYGGYSPGPDIGSYTPEPTYTDNGNVWDSAAQAWRDPNSGALYQNGQWVYPGGQVWNEFTPSTSYATPAQPWETEIGQLTDFMTPLWEQEYLQEVGKWEAEQRPKWEAQRAAELNFMAPLWEEQWLQDTQAAQEQDLFNRETAARELMLPLFEQGREQNLPPTYGVGQDFYEGGSPGWLPRPSTDTTGFLDSMKRIFAEDIGRPLDTVLGKPLDYIAELGADFTPLLMESTPLGGILPGAYRAADYLTEQVPTPFGWGLPDLPTRGDAAREVLGDLTDYSGTVEEFRSRPFEQQLLAGAVYDPTNLIGVGYGDEIVDVARTGAKAARQFGDEAVSGALRAGDEFGQAMGRSMADVGSFTGLGPGWAPGPSVGRMVDDGLPPAPRRPDIPEAIPADLLRDETGAVDLGMLVDATDAVRRRVLGVFDDAATREGRPRAGGIFDDIAPTEKAGRGLVRQYEGATGTAGLELRRTIDDGNRLLRDASIKGTWDGKRFNVKPGQQAVDDLYAALHGEGPVPPQLQQVYDLIKREVAKEEAATVAGAEAFGKEFIPRDDYFYRGWKAPKATHAGTGRGQFGVTPGYQKPRADATYREMRQAGWEPASWNPLEMLGLRRAAGVQWREQQSLLRGLKEAGQAVPLSEVQARNIQGWRVPQVGPAFQGKSVPYIPNTPPGQLAESASRAALFDTEPIAVPNALANTIEGIFGTRPDFGAGNHLLNAGQALKRNKLMISLFQQIDFTGRTLGAMTGSVVDELAEVAISTAKLRPLQAAGHAFQAGRKLLKVPVEIAKLPIANVSGRAQRGLTDSILSGKPILKDRPGITLRGISEAGGKFGEDLSIITKDVRADLREAAEQGPPSWLGQAHDATTGRVTRNINRLNAAAQRGLFDGVYVQAQKTAAENFIVPRLVRQHPDWADGQIMAAAADELNKMYSTLGRYQTVIQNPALNELARGFIFSTNETEALLRGAASTVVGPNKRLWTEFYLGTFFALAGVATLIHKASTGEWLPTERLNPVVKDDRGFIPISYNSRFLSPDIPLKGRNGTRLSLDLVGQMDTAFRLLDPKSFVQSRENVLVRAATTQLTGKSFFGEDVGGTKGRLSNLAADLFEPIGVQQARGVAGVGPGLAEGRIGKAGYAIQTAGLNVRGESNQMLKDRAAQERFGKPWAELNQGEQRQLTNEPSDFQREIEVRKDEAAQRYNQEVDPFQFFDRKDQRYAELEADLRPKIEAGLKGQALREAVSDFKGDRWQAAQALLAGPEVQAVLNDPKKKRQLEDTIAEAYWGAPVPESVVGGELKLDFDARDQARAALLEQARAAGIDTNYITGTGLGTFRGERFKDPVVKEAVATVEQVQDKIERSGYWDLKDKAWSELNGQSAAPGYQAGEGYYDWRARLISETADSMVRSGIDPALAPVKAEDAVDGKHPVVKKFNEAYKQRYYYPWVDQHPEEMMLLIEWYDVNPDKKVEGFLGALKSGQIVRGELPLP